MRGSGSDGSPAAPARRRHRGVWRAAAALLPGLALGAGTARAVDPVIFSAFGDVPYSSSEIADLQQHIADHNRYSPSAFLVHLGDIKSGTDACQESQYQTVADILKGSEVPVFIVPGDNEWVNCSNPDQAWTWWTTHLLGLEQSFCGIWPVEAQATRPENFAFVRNGVLFIGLNYVSGTPSAVVTADAAWVNAQFAAHAAAARAAVLLAQKEPGGALLTAVLANGRAFAKPLLYMHGNGHSWLVDTAFFGEPNMLRVQVDRGSIDNPPVRVTVTADAQFLFERDPWPPGTPTVTRPICSDEPALSIDDVFAAEGQDATFTVSLAGASGAAVSVGYATQDGSARAGEDYVAQAGTLSFSGSTLQRTVRVPVSQDAIAEPGESFAVNLSSPSGAAISKPQGTAVILDDDSAPPPSGGPVLREAVTGGSTSSSTVTTASPLGGQAGDLYLAAVSSKPYAAVASVQGLGLAWTPVRAQCGGRAQTGVALFRAQAVAATGGSVAATFSSAPGAAVIAVARYAGANAAGAIGSVRSANTNGISGSCSGGIDGATYAFDLATGAANSLVFVAVGMRNRDHIPGSGYAETAEAFAGSSGSVAGTSLAQRLLGSAGTAGVSGSFDSTVDWAVVAAEVLAAGTAPPQTVQLSVSTTAGGSVSLSPPGGSYTAGTLVTLTATPSAGYAFGGWGGALSGSANPTTLLMDANKSVTATFAQTLYSLGVTTSGNGSVTLSPPGGSYAPGTLVTLTATPGAGYAFGGWGGALSGSANPTTLLMNASKSVTATFTQTLYSLGVTTSGSGSVSLSPPGGSYAPGTLVTLTATPGAGYAFGGWGGALSGSANPTTLLMNANKSVTASFAQTLYSLGVTTSGSGSVTLSPPGGSYAPGTLVTLTAVPGAGASFLGWGGSLSGTQSPATLAMDASKTVSASFTTTTTYTLTVGSAPHGRVTLSPPGGVYAPGTVVTLTAVADSGWLFKSWSGALSGSANPATLVMDASKSVTPSFRKRK